MIYTPPPGMTDPVVRRIHRDRAHWSREIRRQIVGQANIAVARALADYGNKDGSNCHPGVARLAADLCASERTVIRAMNYLTEAGWITMTKRGARKLGQANVYQLALPVPYAIELGLCPADTPAWIERPPPKPKTTGFVGDTEATYKSVLGDNPQVSRCQTEPFYVTKDPFLGDTGGTPPGSNHQGEIHQGNNHHAALRALAPR